MTDPDGYEVPVSYHPIPSSMTVKSRMPSDLVQELLEACTRVLADDQAVDYDSRLAGVMEQGQQVGIAPTAIPKSCAMFNALGRDFIQHLIKLVGRSADTTSVLNMWETFESQVIDAWVVRQLAGDYNPVHTHPPATLSGVVHLKVPPQINKDRYPHGWLVFVHPGAWAPERLEFAGAADVVLPEPGVVYVFPGWLRHLVYPFQGEGERWCVSFNVRATPKGAPKRFVPGEKEGI